MHSVNETHISLLSVILKVNYILNDNNDQNLQNT